MVDSYSIRAHNPKGIRWQGRRQQTGSVAKYQWAVGKDFDHMLNGYQWYYDSIKPGSMDDARYVRAKRSVECLRR